jgi:hypothetical protein
MLDTTADGDCGCDLRRGICPAAVDLRTHQQKTQGKLSPNRVRQTPP